MSFKSSNSYSKFSLAVNRKQRYILDEDSKAFLNSIIETCKDRETILKANSIVWRAQIGCDLRPYSQTDPDSGENVWIDDFEIPFPSNRMKPLPHSASEGRANPKGIPCLYVASDKETAMSEVRPWLGSVISIGRFKLKKELKILDFSIEYGRNNIHFMDVPEEEILKTVWCDIDNAFSTPTKTSDITSNYAPTQIISEFIKSKGYDGIAYKSSLADGHNFAIFDLGAADLISCFVFTTSRVKFDFEKIDSPFD